MHLWQLTVGALSYHANLAVVGQRSLHLAENGFDPSQPVLEDPCSANAAAGHCAMAKGVGADHYHETDQVVRNHNPLQFCSAVQKVLNGPVGESHGRQVSQMRKPAAIVRRPRDKEHLALSSAVGLSAAAVVNVLHTTDQLAGCGRHPLAAKVRRAVFGVSKRLYSRYSTRQVRHTGDKDAAVYRRTGDNNLCAAGAAGYRDLRIGEFLTI